MLWGKSGPRSDPSERAAANESIRQAHSAGDGGRTVSILSESTLILDEICIGIAIMFVVDRVWRRGKKKTPTDQLRRDSWNI